MPADDLATARRCSRLSRSAGEDLAGTASTVRRWILVEQPGPWGADALRQSRIAADTAERLARLGERLRARVLLIRRHGRARDVRPRTAFAAVTTAGGSWVERLAFADPAELLERDWDGLAGGRTVGGDPVDDPLFLVCTNGSHDACCAELGRPVAAALTAREPDATWESSHFGGDRFAGNVVCLPHGLYYGRVTAETAPELAAATRGGRLVLPHFRGRSNLPFGVQAAEIALRRAGGLVGIADLDVVARERLPDGVLRVTFRDPGGRHHVVAVTAERTGEPRPLSCGAARAVAPARFHTEVLATDG